MDQADLKLTESSLALPPECWDLKYVSPKVVGITSHYLLGFKAHSIKWIPQLVLHEWPIGAPGAMQKRRQQKIVRARRHG